MTYLPPLPTRKRRSGRWRCEVRSGSGAALDAFLGWVRSCPRHADLATPIGPSARVWRRKLDTGRPLDDKIMKVGGTYALDFHP